MVTSQLNLNLVLTGAVSGATVGSSGSIIVPTVFDLRTVASPNSSHLYQTTGYWGLNDGGAACYYWDDTDTTSFDNGATIITVAGAESAGRLKLLPLDNKINVKQFGAIGDGTNRYLTNSYNGHTRFNSLAAAVSALGSAKGSWAELLSTGDSLDAVGIQQAITFGIASGYVVTLPQGSYRITRGVWVGEYDHVDSSGPTYNWWMKSGFTLRGDSYIPRQQTDGDCGVGILCIGDIANRWTLRLYNSGTLPSTGGVTLKLWWGAGQTTSLIPFNASPTAVKNIIESLSDVGTGAVTVSSPTGANLASGATYVISFVRNLPTGTKSFHGEIKVASNTLNNSCYPVIYCDSGILNLRGQANQQFSIENIGLSGNWVTVSDDHYDASCGINLAHSTMNNHRFRGIRTYSTRWGIIMNENDGGNGESHLFEKVISSGCLGYLYMSGGQSYNIKHIYWEVGSDGPLEAGDNSERVLVQLAPSTILGFSMDFFSGETRFYDDPIPKQTFLKISGVGTFANTPQHLGTINFISTRTEHMTTLVNADFMGSWNHHGTVNFYGHEFTVRGSIASGHSLFDDLNQGSASQYKINVENSVFETYDSYQDLYINITPASKSEITFTNCTFSEFRSRKISAPYVKFINCRYSDYGLTDTGRVRQWDETYDLRAKYADGGFGKNNNNPWLFSGHVEQGMVNASFLGASGGATTAPSGWFLVNSVGVSGQVFTDSGINVPGKSFTQFGAWGQGAFAYQLPQGYSLVQYLNSYVGSGDLTTRVNMVYRTKVSVPSGSVEFRLEYKNSGTVIDSVVLTDLEYNSAPTIVTLHCATNVLAANEPPVLRIKVLSSTAVVQHWWQHTFRMGSPAIFGYSGESDTQHYDGLMSSLRVLDRLVLPSQTYTNVQGAGVAVTPRIGDSYYDSEVDRLMFYGNTWKPIGDSLIVVTGASASGLQYALTGAQALGQTLVASSITPVPTGVIFPNTVRTWTVVNGTPSGLGLYCATKAGSALVAPGKTAIFRGDGQNNISRVTPDT